MAVGSANACLPDETIFSFVQGKLPRNDAKGVDEHLSRCSDCRTVVAEAARFLFQDAPQRQDAPERTLPSPEETSHHAEDRAETDYPLLHAGTEVSRYVIGEVIGAGAAGVVYRARDPQLKLSIALKLLRPDRSRPSDREKLQAQLLREAQAMAQLSHPNVVTVFDVGTYGDRIFIVMELVEGQTLGGWLAERRPEWPEIMRAFIDAGRGLAAAHAVQIVHRDFKPANVLVGRDGRVRVTDFGLARPMELANAEPETISAGPPARNAASPLASLTVTEGGALAGTPNFMAPEQFLGRRTVARTDQFSFCVALYIALYGNHPFADDAPENRTLTTLAKAVVEGVLRPAAGSSPVPPPVYDVLARGLRPNPGERFYSIQELLDALTDASNPESSRPRRRYPAVFLAAAVALGLGSWAVRSSRGGSPGACRGRGGTARRHGIARVRDARAAGCFRGRSRSAGFARGRSDRERKAGERRGPSEASRSAEQPSQGPRRFEPRQGTIRQRPEGALLMRRAWLSCSAAFLLATLASSRSASASDEDTASRARTLYQEGARLYNLGHYEAAVGAFESAYALSGAKPLLFNIAQANRLAGPSRCSKALQAYESYLREDSAASNRGEVEERITEMRACVDQERQRRAAGEATLALAPPPVDRSHPAAAPSAPGAAAKIVAAAGGVVLLAGGGMLIAAHWKYDQVKSTCPCERGAFATWEAVTTTSYVLIAAGGAAVVGGLSFWLTAPRAAGGSAVGVTLGPAGLRLAGTF